MRERLALLEKRETERREAERDPKNWGPSAELYYLPSAANVDIARDEAGRVIRISRADPFDTLYARRAIGDPQHQAVRRLFRDYCFRAGVRDAERAGMELQKIDGGRHDPSSMVTDAMVDAGRRIAFVGRHMGPIFARVLEYQIEPIIARDGGTTVWRWHVERATGIKEPHAQGQVLALACEAARIAYEACDDEERRRADERAGRVA